jgi:hypothetical protein
MHWLAGHDMVGSSSDGELEVKLYFNCSQLSTARFNTNNNNNVKT